MKSANDNKELKFQYCNVLNGARIPLLLFSCNFQISTLVILVHINLDKQRFEDERLFQGWVLIWPYLMIIHLGWALI